MFKCLVVEVNTLIQNINFFFKPDIVPISIITNIPVIYLSSDAQYQLFYVFQFEILLEHFRQKNQISYTLIIM